MSEYISGQPEKFAYTDQLLDIVSQYLDAVDAEFMLDLDEQNQIDYVYDRLIERDVDPDFIFREFGIVDAEEIDESDLIMSDIDSRAETLGDIFNHPEAFSKVIEIINKEYSSEV